MKFKINNRQSLSVISLLLYCVPLFFFAFYSFDLLSRHQNWLILSFGLLLVLSSGLILFALLYYWEQALQKKWQTESAQLISNSLKENKVTSLDTSFITHEELEDSKATFSKELSFLQTNLKEKQTQQERLLEEIQNKNQALASLAEEKELLLAKNEQVIRDFSDYKVFSEEQLKQKSLQISAFQQTITEQQTEMERRQSQIQQLDTKVHDLSYEIKTLLYLNESDSIKDQLEPERPATMYSIKNNVAVLEHQKEVSIKRDINFSEQQIKSPAEAMILLRRCVQIAQKLTGSSYYGNEASRYWEIASPHYTIDQRRLFDSLKSEKGALIFVYSARENKALFVNHQAKEILGWSPEKFVQDFNHVIEEGTADWKKALTLLVSTPESQTRLLMRAKQGQEILMQCHLGSVPSGLFRNYVIAVAYAT